jgi:hypothetical protein
MTTGSDAEMQGWYRVDNEAPPLRVRLSIEGGSLHLHSLAGALVAQWSVDQLENRTVPVFGRDWVISDRRLPRSALTLENDRDYSAIRMAGAALLPVRERVWRQFLFYPTESGNLTNWPVLLPIGVAILALAACWFLFF